MDHLRADDVAKSFDLLGLPLTIVNNSKQIMQIFSNGNCRSEISAWSKIDFNYLSGFSTFKVNSSDGTFRDFGLLIGISYSESYRIQKRMAKNLHDY
jgi:hypothetical protein